MANQSQTSTNLSNQIWNVANDLWGDFKHTDFARIVLPLLLLRRLECVLEPTKEGVLAAYNAQKNNSIDPELYLPSIAGTRFFNTSNYSLGNPMNVALGCLIISSSIDIPSSLYSAAGDSKPVIPASI